LGHGGRIRIRPALLTGTILSLGLAVADAGVDPPAKSSSARYLVHHIERPVGEERDQFARDASGLTLTSTLQGVDRGSRIELAASLRLDPDLTPVRFEARGKTYRFVNVDTVVEVREGSAQVRNSTDVSTVKTPRVFFTARGYAPLAARALLIEYWERHGRPPEIPLLPDLNLARIRLRGVDFVTAGGRSVRLRRYSVDGVVWGREAVWLDDENRLAALFTRIHILPLEAVRDDLGEALPALQARAVTDRIADSAAFRDEMKPVAEGAFALVGARLIGGGRADAAPIDDSTVVIEDGRIVAAGPRITVAIPKGVRIIKAEGKTIVPGLWDMHGHVGQIEWGPAYLAAGVTTVRDVGGEGRFLTAFRDSVANGHGLGPELLLAGLVDGGGPNGYGTTIATTPDEARAIVDVYQAAGFVQMKLYSQLAPDVVAAITRRAHDLGMKVTGHIPTALSFRSAIESGMDQFEHLAIRGEPGSPEVRDTVRFLAARGTVAGPTLAWDELLGRDPTTPISTFEPGILQAPIPLASSYASVRNDIDAARAQANRGRGLALIATLREGGVRMVAGTDGALPGHSVLRTLELFVEAGMTPREAIASASSVPAKFMGLDRTVGTIEAGRRADLLVLDADPLERIANIRKGRWVVAAGRMYDVAALWRTAEFTPSAGRRP
jgi:imidazolonepropionase-like amidohydrolase